jgi:predicted AlkP superfamily phosphohydrolase/phosphomutase
VHGAKRAIVLGLDACDPNLAARLAAEGELPTLKRLLAGGTAAPILPPPGVFVSANWPTLFTGVRPDRHGYLCWDDIDPATYAHGETEPSPSSVRATPLWQALEAAGRRCVVIDVPHTWATELDGAMLVEWGCHDRHHGPHSWPPSLLDEINATVGEHPVGTAPSPGREQFAPCDYLDRAGELRTPAEEAALLDRLRAGVEHKRRAAAALFERGDWDLFLCVIGETHCAGHQFWQHHDATHPRHDPAAVSALGGDPVLDIYRRVDAAVGDLVQRLTPDDVLYLLLPHGMVTHYDGTDVLDPILARLDRHLDDPASTGLRTRLAAAPLRLLPQALRRPGARLAAPFVRRRLAEAPPATDEPLPPLPERRWFALPNNSVTGAVRLNLAGREGAGRLRPEARREVLEWLAERLREVVNVDTGSPIVREVIVTDDVYRRHDGDRLADLYVEWERSQPIERVWSPVVGTIERPYTHWRTGDHRRRGLLLAVGPGIAAGAQAPEIVSADVAPTVAAALGVTLSDVDGHAAERLLPSGAAPVVRRRSESRSSHAALARSLATLERRAGRRRARALRWDAPRAPGIGGVTDELDGLAAAHHVTREMVERLRLQVDELERQALVARKSAWVRQQPIEAKTLVSVVLPTHNRRELVEQAIGSVRAQTYPNWELLVVDDASSDGTDRYLSSLDDPRIRCFRSEGSGAAAARNVALDHANGDVVVHLDDDNRFDTDWLKAVVLTFDERPDARVAYGARFIDDTGRQHGNEPNGEVGFQLLRWDREATLQFNRVDMNVLAHRPGPARFDEGLRMYVDWDLLLTLTADTDPVEIPVVAAYYTTDAPGRLTDRLSRHDQEQEQIYIRAKQDPAP